MQSIGIVSATRLTEADFWLQSPLGASLRRLSQDPRLNICIAFENVRGLSEVYNEVIDAEFAHDYLVFIHDDVWIEDSFFCDHIVTGCEVFDVIGIAGNQRRAPGQVSWAFLSSMKWDDRANLSGRLGYGDKPFGGIDFFGVAPAQCELLDGVFFAVKKSVLRQQQLRFDPNFDFDFYDMDFCRSARAKGLSLGTWSISMTHRSEGAFATQRWIDSLQRYMTKWGD